MVWILLLFATLAVSILAFGLALRPDGRSRTLRQRIRAFDAPARRPEAEHDDLLRDDALSGIPALHKLLERWSGHVSLQLLLSQAGVDMRAGTFLLVCSCVGGLGWCAAAWATGMPALALLAGGGAGVLPVVAVKHLRARRFRRFEELFPNAIDLVVRSVRAGHPLSHSLRLLADETAEPVAGEFRLLYEEQNFGLPIRDALLHLSRRVPLLDVRFFVSTIVLQRETGGNLAEILEKLAYLIRERFKIRREVRTYTAQGRMTMMLLMSLPPGIMLLLLAVNRAFIMPLFTDPVGHLLLAGGAVSQTIGFFLIRRIADVKV